MADRKWSFHFSCLVPTTNKSKVMHRLLVLAQHGKQCIFERKDYGWGHTWKHFLQLLDQNLAHLVNLLDIVRFLAV